MDLLLFVCHTFCGFGLGGMISRFVDDTKTGDVVDSE